MVGIPNKIIKREKYINLGSKNTSAMKYSDQFAVVTSSDIIFLLRKMFLRKCTKIDKNGPKGTYIETGKTNKSILNWTINTESDCTFTKLYLPLYNCCTARCFQPHVFDKAYVYV